MRDSEIQLFNAAFEIKKILGVLSFEYHQYDDGSYIDIITARIAKPSDALLAANGHVVLMFARDGMIVVRIYEKYPGE